MHAQITFNTILGETSKTVSLPSYLFVKIEKRTGEWIKISDDDSEFQNDDRNVYTFKTIHVNDTNKEVMAWFWDRDTNVMPDGEDDNVYLAEGLSAEYDPSLGNVPYKLVQRVFPSTDPKQDALDAINALNISEDAKAAMIAVVENS